MLKIPASLAIRLALAIALDTGVQILWKLAASQLPASAPLAATVAAALSQPLFALVAVLFAWQLVNWLRVLEGSDLSYAQPITSLSLVSVLVLSSLLLGERIDLPKLTGIALIFAGVFFISRTPHDSNPGGPR